MLEVSLYSPERPLANTTAKEVVIPGSQGYLGILPGHTALVSELGSGHLKIIGTSDGSDSNYFISGGYLEVSNNKVKILVDVVERLDEIDFDRAAEAEKRAAKRLDEAKGDMALDISRALAALERAKARKALKEFHDQK